MRIVRIEDRRLPMSFRFTNACVTKRPIHALLWHIWLFSAFAIVCTMDPWGDHHRVLKLNGISILLWSLSLFFLSDLVSASSRKSGREWLFQVITDDELGPVSGSARLGVRLIPVLGVFAIVTLWASG
jgi:hypothetical protein